MAEGKVVLWRPMYDPQGHQMLIEAGLDVVIVDSALGTAQSPAAPKAYESGGSGQNRRPIQAPGNVRTASASRHCEGQSIVRPRARIGPAHL